MPRVSLPAQPSSNSGTKLLKGLSAEEKALLKEERNFYKVDLKNLGGLVMPVVLKVTFEDGSTKEYRLPAQIWRRNPEAVSKLLITEKKITKLELDPHREIEDARDLIMQELVVRRLANKTAEEDTKSEKRQRRK